MATTETKFCKHCGQTIPADAVICTHCGRQVEDINRNSNQPIVINNSASAAASSSSSVRIRRKRKYSLFADILLICFTGGLWLIWMLLRPKYE